MADHILDIADRMWRGEITTDERHPVSGRNLAPLHEVTDDVAFIGSMANVTAIDTEDGLVFVDTGSEVLAPSIHSAVREWKPSSPLHTAVYSHGHIDHVFGVPLFDEEAREKGWRRPTVVAHENLPHRFDRYVMTAGYNGIINARQFRLGQFEWPTEYRYPDHTYHDAASLDVGGVAFSLHHCPGETDDHTWTWIPSRRVLCTGDLFIWACPNAGNPQKVQRYPREWAAGLRKMLALDPAPELLLPGHGVPIAGADRIRQALSDTAELLESLVDQTLALMNEGARLNDIIHSVSVPAHLSERPYLQPVYDEPEFIVRNLWRLYGGWYDGNPANLKPASDASLAAELASLAGGASRLADRASALVEEGDLRLACHLAELAALAAPEDAGVHEVRASVFAARASAERSTMAKGVYSWAAEESSKQ